MPSIDLSRVPREVLEEQCRYLATRADRDSAKIPYHFKFRPDAPVLALMPVESGGAGELPTIRFDAALSHLPAGQNGPIHRLIIGDNFQALVGLTVAGASYDLIYIDPPYNTGREDMVYNDRFSKDTDAWFHTDWSSFMEPRLHIAQRLLKDTGIIMCAIGLSELHRLRFLMDAAFGEDNFIAQVNWDASRKNDARFVSNSTDFMLIYARNKRKLIAADVRWRVLDEDAEKYFAAAKAVWDSTEGEADRQAVAKKKFAAKVRRSFTDAPQELVTFNRFDERGRLYASGGDMSFPGGNGYVYDVLHPLTGEPCAFPSRGYVCTEDTMRQLISDGLIEFGADHTTQVKKRRFEYTGVSPKSTFVLGRRNAVAHVASILGEKVFPYPKDHTVLARWINAAAPENAKILDFFGGSGSTAEAALLLNSHDGGTRESTTVVDDFNSIGTSITRERIVRVMTGDGWSDGDTRSGYGGRLAVHRVSTTPDIDHRDEEDWTRWSRDAGVWATWVDFPVEVSDEQNFVRVTDCDGGCALIAYSMYSSDDVADEMVGEFRPKRFITAMSGGGGYAHTEPYHTELELVPRRQRDVVHTTVRATTRNHSSRSFVTEITDIANTYAEEAL